MSDLQRRQMEDTIETLTEEVDQLRAERDALLGAAKAVIAAGPSVYDSYYDGIDEWENLRTAVDALAPPIEGA